MKKIYVLVLVLMLIPVGVFAQGLPLKDGNTGTLADVEVCGALNCLQVSLPAGGTLPLPTGAATEVTLATRLAETTFTGRFAIAYIDADTIANQTTTAMHGQLYGYNGVTWDRLRSTIANGLAVDVTRLTGNVTVVQGTGTNLHIVCDSGCGGAASFTDNSAFTFGTTSINNAGYVFDDVAPNAVTENSAATPRMSANRIPYGIIRDGAGNERGANVTVGNALAVDGSGVTQPVSGSVTANAGTNLNTSALALDATVTNRFPVGSTPADNESNIVTISRLGTFGYIFDGTAWDRWTGAVSQSGTWNIGTVATITNPVTVTDGAGALNVIVDSGTLTAVTSITNTVTVQGAKSHNGGAPGATNVGVLPCVATAADPTYTEGSQVGCSTTLVGAERVEVRQATAANLNNRPDTSGATGSAPPARADFVGGLSSGATGGLVQGIAVCDSFQSINISTITTTLLVTGVAGRHIRICGMSVVTTLANTVALISGTGATCGTGTTGMSGGTTAATGWSFAANGGLAQGSGVGVINQTNATGDSMCLVSGVATQLSGRLSYAIY